tara:strand:- start:16084 stop:16692 length:609 start_codon:yes stop_codon:yes gene_type:complete
MKTLNPYLDPILKEIDHYLNSVPQSNEHQIIKHLQESRIPPFDNFELANAKDLFHAHFLCMHALYHLKSQYVQDKKYRLIIQSVRVERFVLADQHSAINPTATQACLEASDPLARYYLDPKHYFETQEDDITDMLKSFWTKYLAQDQKQAALKILHLPLEADAKMIKEQYKRLAQKHHPDKGGCANMFNKVRQAKATLDKAF